MGYTNLGLVKHAQKALKLKTKYMWGGILKLIEQQYDTLKRIYGNQSGTGYDAPRWNELKELCNTGTYGCDCVGLIKSYYWSGKDDGGAGSPNYGKAGYPDVNATTMYNYAKVKGSIDTMPDIPGLVVYCKTHPHVGVYIGNGYVIESTLSRRGDGVVKTKLSDFTWEYWFECPYIEYVVKTQTTSIVKTKKVTLAFPAKVRAKATTKSAELGKYEPGQTCTIIIGSDRKDSVSGYTYVRLSGDTERWIVKSAIKGG